MKQIQLLITIIAGQLLFSASVNATDITDSTALSKQYYHNAKEQFKDMLSGKEELGYEKAITIVENAYWDNEADLEIFNSTINFHIENIKQIIESYKDETIEYEDILVETKEQQEEKYNNALINWSIYKYMTDTTFFIEQGKLLYHPPFTYSFQDPLGTIFWGNTQVFNVIDYNEGNCYALVSLFKIFSERLKSEAFICTAPGHIYIRHADHKGIYHNVEIANKAFPGTGSLETLTYTTDEATKNGISLRELNLKQSVALNLVYLAKGYEYKFGVKDDDFIMECAELALQYDELNLNAMLLKAEVLEERLIKKDKPIKALQSDKTFQEYEKLITHLFDLGYREMPKEMKNLVISRLRKEDSPYPMTDHTPRPFEDLGIKEERYATLSNGLFDEQMLTKPVEQYHRTMFDTKQKKITKLVELDTAYNKYPIDLVVFAWQIDPLDHEFPSWSPYNAFQSNPIVFTDETGEKINWFGSTGVWKLRKALLATPTGKDIWKAMRKSRTSITVNVTNQVLVVNRPNGNFAIVEGDFSGDMYGNKEFEGKGYSAYYKSGTLNISLGTQQLKQKIAESYGADSWDNLTPEQKNNALQKELSTGNYEVYNTDDNKILQSEEYGNVKALTNPYEGNIKITPPLENETSGEYLNRVGVHEGSHSVNDAVIRATYNSSEKTSLRIKLEDKAYFTEGKTIKQQKYNRAKSAPRFK